jgi:hypothetical protein
MAEYDDVFTEDNQQVRTLEEADARIEHLQTINRALSEVLAVVVSDPSTDARTVGFILGVLKAKGFDVKRENQNA